MEKLEQLGARLKAARLKRNDTQKSFAARIGVSIPTLTKMEKGDPSATMGHWAAALRILDRENDLDQLLTSSQDLFEKFEQQQAPQRRRATGRRP